LVHSVDPFVEELTLGLILGCILTFGLQDEVAVVLQTDDEIGRDVDYAMLVKMYGQDSEPGKSATARRNV
jgi:hypothetical protein